MILSCHYCSDPYRTQIGDFGSARVTNPLDPNNPQAFEDDASTEGYRGPVSISQTPLCARLSPTNTSQEQFGWGGHPDDRSWKLLARINIYQIGMILLSLMQLEWQPEQQNFRRKSQRVRAIDDLRAPYSAALQDAVRRCLRFEPATRITPGRLFMLADRELTALRAAIDVSRNYHFSIGSRVTRSSIRGRDVNLKHWKTNDNYRVGLSVPRRAAARKKTSARKKRAGRK